MRTIHISLPASEMRRRLALIPAKMAGDVADRRGLVDAIKMRLAVQFFVLVKAAFVIKARGGTDEAGIRWPALDAKTIAYSRRKSVMKTTKRQRKLPHVQPLQSTRAYKLAYRESLARLLVTMPRERALPVAKNIAAVKASRETGAATKIGVARRMSPGADYEILRDTGVLLNSLSPGVASGKSYAPQPDQIAAAGKGELVVGTNVKYAATHHYGSQKRNIPQRPLWPESNQIPDSWINAFAEIVSRGLKELLLEFAELDVPFTKSMAQWSYHKAVEEGQRRLRGER